MRYDFNVLENRADELLLAGKPSEAIKIYLFMADGDLSLDGGYLGKKIAECYQILGDLHAAKYWFGRAVEENPEINEYVKAREKLEHININALVSPDEYQLDDSEV
jgi:tetratricopeptide (TPR) repeat protein